MEKTKVLNLLKDADISVLDWEYAITSQIQDKYARGYLECAIEHVGEFMSHCTEEFQNMLLQAACYDIWGK